MKKKERDYIISRLVEKDIHGWVYYILAVNIIQTILLAFILIFN